MAATLGDAMCSPVRVPVDRYSALGPSFLVCIAEDEAIWGIICNNYGRSKAMLFRPRRGQALECLHIPCATALLVAEARVWPPKREMGRGGTAELGSVPFC